MPVRQLRPTALLVRMGHDGEGFIYMIAGDSKFTNICYDTRNNIWKFLPHLPNKHNVTCNVCVNYFDRAIFTFFVDGHFNMKAAVMNIGPVFDTPA